MFQKIGLSVVLFFTLSIVLFFLVIKVIDFNEYKPKIQKMIKEATGYELAIKGDITLSLTPVGVSILNVEVSNPSYQSDAPFAQLGSFDVAIEIAPLLRKEVKVKYIALEKLTLLIEKTQEGKFNFEIPTANVSPEKKQNETNSTISKESNLPLVNVKKIRFEDANIRYIDNEAKRQFTLNDIDLSINDINYDALKHRIQGLSFKAESTIAQAKYDKYTVKDIAMNFDMKESIATIESLKYTLFDTPIQGSGKIDLSGKSPQISIKSKITDLKLSELSKEIFGEPFLEGMANGDLKLSFFLGDMLTVKNTLGGFVQLFGEGVNVKGYDVDKILSTFDANQNSAKETNFASLLSGSITSFKGGNSVLYQINTKFDIGYSEIKLSDVALSTSRNRLAFNGALQIIEEKFLDVKVALVDTKGCSIFEQTIVGTFDKPALKLDEKSFNAITNVALSLLGKSKKVQIPPKMPEENCTPFYEGVVKHPVAN